MDVGALARSPRIQERPLFTTSENFRRGKQDGTHTDEGGWLRCVGRATKLGPVDQAAPRRNRHQLGQRKAAQNCARLRYKLFRSNRLKGKRPQTCGSRVVAHPVLPWVLTSSWVGAHLDHMVQGGSMNAAFLANLGWLTTTWAADFGSEDTTRPEKPELCVRPGLLSQSKSKSKSRSRSNGSGNCDNHNNNDNTNRNSNSNSNTTRQK